MVILTSGTTGPPKGARIARASGLEPLAWYLSVVPIHAGSVCLIPAPLYHAHGLGQFTIATALGCTVVLPRAFDAEETLALIERHRVEVMAVVPTMLSRIMDLDPATHRRYETSSLRVVVCSGSALDARLARSFMEEFGPVLYNLYGSTEVAWATIATPRGPAGGARHRGAATAPHPPRDPRRGRASRCRPAPPVTYTWPTRCCSRVTRTRARTASA